MRGNTGCSQLPQHWDVAQGVVKVSSCSMQAATAAWIALPNASTPHGAQPHTHGQKAKGGRHAEHTAVLTG